MNNINGFTYSPKKWGGMVKALCLSFFFLGLTLVICAFVLPKYLTLNHNLGSYVFADNQEIDVNVDIDVSNEYELILSFPTKQFEKEKNWDMYGFGDWITSINGKLVNPGLPISLRFNITSKDNIITSFADIAQSYSGCPYFGNNNTPSRCRTAKAVFMVKGINNIKLILSAKEEFFQGREFRLKLKSSIKASPQSSFIFKLMEFSMNNILLIILFSLLTFVPYIIIDIKEGHVSNTKRN